MKEITGTFGFNEDGSVNLPTGENNQPVKWVKEADLLAVKGGATQKTTEWENEKVSYNTKLAEANRLREETHQNLLKEQATKEQLVSKYQDYDTLKTKVGELEKNLGSHKESVGKVEKELTDRIKANLIGYGTTEDAIKEKTLDQLRNLEEAAKLFVGAKGKPAKYDGGSGGGGAPEAPLDRAKRIIVEAEEKRRRPMVVSNTGAKV